MDDNASACELCTKPKWIAKTQKQNYNSWTFIFYFAQTWLTRIHIITITFSVIAVVYFVVWFIFILLIHSLRIVRLSVSKLNLTTSFVYSYATSSTYSEPSTSAVESCIYIFDCSIKWIESICTLKPQKYNKYTWDSHMFI